MTVASEISRLQTAKSSIKISIENKGVTVPSETKLDGYSQLIDTISSGEWAPDPNWPQNLSTWTPSGGIGFIMSNADYGKAGFIVDTDSANYTVVINDGTTDISTTSYASGAQCDVSMARGDGTTYYAVKITSTSNITRFRVAKPSSVAASQSRAPILYLYGNLSTLTTMESMLYATSGGATCYLLQAAYILSTTNVTNFNNAFFGCSNLISLCGTVFDATNASNINALFSSCAKLKETPNIINTSNVTNMSSVFKACASMKTAPSLNTISCTVLNDLFAACAALETPPPTINTSSNPIIYNMFAGCKMLKSLPSITWPNVTSYNSAISENYHLPSFTFDLSTKSNITSFGCSYSPAITGVLLPSNAAWGSIAPQVDITNDNLERTALIALFNSLGTVTGKTIKITGNPGVSSLTAADLLIATNKGWTVTTT